MIGKIPALGMDPTEKAQLAWVDTDQELSRASDQLRIFLIPVECRAKVMGITGRRTFLRLRDRFEAVPQIQNISNSDTENSARPIWGLVQLCLCLE